MPNRSEPSFRKVHVPEELYTFAHGCNSVQQVASRLVCSKKIATALRKHDQTLLVTPLELDLMQLQLRRLERLNPKFRLCACFRAPDETQLKYINLLRAAAKFAADYKAEIGAFRGHGKKPSAWSAVRWHRNIAEFADGMTRHMIPHLRQTWKDFPDFRELFFGGTGFEEAYIRKKKTTK
jgi:hypothetical protein